MVHLGAAGLTHDSEPETAQRDSYTGVEIEKGGRISILAMEGHRSAAL